MRIRVLATAAVLLAAFAGVLAQTGARQISLLVTNGIVVTMDGAGRVIQNGGVAVDGADIVAVDTADAIRKQFRGTDTIDAAGGSSCPASSTPIRTRRWSSTAGWQTTSRSWTG